MKSSFVIPTAIIIGGLIVAAAVYTSTKPVGLGKGDPSLVRPASANDHIFGNPAAPVQIIEYSDFDCTYCKSFDETLRQLVANEGAGGKVAWVYRHFPLSELHPNAFAHARAAECAGSVGGNEKFWRFVEVLFANQPAEPARYGALAAAAGIDGTAFATCYASASSTLDTRIQADRQNALDMGAQGTPFSLILVTGKPPIVMNGAYSYDAVKQLLGQALGK